MMSIAGNVNQNVKSATSINSTHFNNSQFYGSIQNFHIEKQIGKGQFSEVFRAKCIMDNRIVALKKIKVKLFIFRL